MSDRLGPGEVLLDAGAVARHVAQVAERLAPHLDSEAVAVCLLTGGLWFAADLTRALATLGCNLRFDALWLTSYGDAHASSGRCDVIAGLQRPVTGQTVLLIDDVYDSGLSLSEARRHVIAAGAARVLSVVFARKPWPEHRADPPDFIAWEAPARFLIGYGMDDGGAWRGLPGIAALS